MKGMGMMRLSIGAALASLSQPLSSADRDSVGRATLKSMFMPQFDMGGLDRGSHSKSGKHRAGGRTSPRPNQTTFWKHGTRNRETLRHARQNARSGGAAMENINRHAAARDRWNAEVLPRVLEHQALQRARR